MTTATVNRAEVFKAAWVEVKAYFARCADRGLTPTATLHEKLAYELRQAWHGAKMAAHRAALKAASKPDQIRAALSDLQNKDHWTADDYAQHDRLTAELRGTETTEEAVEREEKRELIAAAGGRFASVTFVKKDGTERTMRVQPAKLKFHLKGEDGNPTARKAAAIRKARHPHLMAVWDVEAKAPRSVNLATVKAITVDGLTHAYS